MAKNKLTRWARMYINGYDLSGDSRNVNQLLDEFAEAEMPGWANSVKNYLSGHRATGGRGYQALINDDTAGSLTALKTAGAKVVSLFLGSSAEPVVGDAAYLLSAAEMSNIAGFDGNAGVISSDFLPVSGAEASPHGKVIFPKTAVSATGSGASVDNGASSANGWHANIHVFATASGNYTFTIEHSSNGSDWTTLGTFTINGSAMTGEALSGTGTVNRYVRLTRTRTGGSCTFAVAFARN